MANAIIILGKSGTGKSTSIKNLDPKTTIVVNVLGKRLPFKGSNSLYNKENKNLYQIENYQDILAFLDRVEIKRPEIKNIILDDSTYVMRKEYFSRAKEKGYEKYTELAQHFQAIIQKIEKMSDNKNVFLILHSEDVQSDKITIGYKVSTIGSLIDNQYNPVEVVPMVLFSSVRYDDKGNASYGFYTHRCIGNGVEIPAKSPQDMFEEDFIPNDLKYVTDKMEEYYN